MMMAGLFLLYAIGTLFLWKGSYRISITLILIFLVLCAFMLIHHATSTLGIRL